MNVVQQFLIGMLLIGAVVFHVSASSGRGAEPIMQAQPIICLLKSVKDKDPKRLQDVFSKRLRAELEELGWDKVLHQYSEAFHEAFGEYVIEDFAFEFFGDKEKGEVSVTFKGKKFPKHSVVHENGEWKMNER